MFVTAIVCTSSSLNVREPSVVTLFHDLELNACHVSLNTL